MSDPTQDDIGEARELRRDAIEALASSKVIRERELEPLWRRITGRREQNDFGREYELSLTPRQRGAA